MRCGSCGFANPEGTKFCGECGQSLTNRCPSCGAENPPPFKFCGACGTSLRPGEQSAPATNRKRKGTPSTKKATRPAAPATTAKSHPTAPEAERRQLTVMFCDVVGSTALSEQLDPEEYRAVVQAYHQRSAAVIGQYEGHIAQYLGDGLLVYFGYPVAHEDDAQRAVRTALGLVAALQHLSFPTIELPRPVQVRIGIHTGLVVVGEIGTGGTREQLALGDTPNVAARLQALTEPDTVVISPATHRLIDGLFDCRDLGTHSVKGVSTPLQVYQVIGESGMRSRLEAAATRGLTPLVGREEESGLLRKRWEQAKSGEGQVVLLSGEAGIGKSRLVQILKEQVAHEPSLQIEYRCSPYYQNSAFYPLIDHFQRLLHFRRDDSPEDKLRKLEAVAAAGALRDGPQRADVVTLVAALLSIPLPPQYPPLMLTPQRQKQKTLETLLAWLVHEAGRHPLLVVVEDVHWVDPSTLEFLSLLLEQVPTTRLLLLLTFRPDFSPPWAMFSHLTRLTLSRLARKQVIVMVEKVTGGKPLPAEVIQQLVTKTDGVPLFVEELTKMVVESGLVQETDGHYELRGPLPPLAIPATLQDSLIARLDRLATVKEVAQLGATLGREFSYELLQAVSLVDEKQLQQALGKLVEAEVLYQQGLPPQARYVFKHALIQDAAYQSLLKSTRQQYHRQIAQILEERFPETQETQPELLAHHYSEAGLVTQAIPYWQHAGERAVQRSANIEAISHLTKGLEVLHTLPDLPERTQQELNLQITLGPTLMATKGYAAPEVEKAYARARALCQESGETQHLFPALWGLWAFYLLRADVRAARELAEQLLALARSEQDLALLLQAHYALGVALVSLGDFDQARAHFEQTSVLYNPQQHRSLAFLYGSFDAGVASLSFTAIVLWLLGYPDQAVKKSQETLTLAQALAHPFSLAQALLWTSWFHLLCREEHIAQQYAEAAIHVSAEQGFSLWLATGMIYRGGALAAQGRREEGIAQLRQGLAAWRVTGATDWPSHLALLVEAHGRAGQIEEGLSVVAEVLAFVDKTGGRFSEAELYRLKGELLLKKLEPRMQKSESNSESAIPSIQHPTPSTQAEAEACFLKAIEIARKQQAKSLELRAVMNLARLWRHQGKTADAHQMLSEIYNWFTEGFDSKDLQEAKALLEDLA